VIRWLLILLGICCSVPAHAADRAAARAAISKGVEAYVEGDLKSSLDHMFKAAEQDKGWSYPVILIANIRASMGDGPSTEVQVRRARAMGVPEADVAHLLGFAALLQGKPKEALVLAEPGRVAKRFQGFAARIRARAHYDLENYAAAGREYDEALKTISHSSRLWADIGRFRFFVGNIAGAIDAASQSVRLGPRNVDALILTGDLVRSQYGLTASLPWFRRAVEVDPTNLNALRELAATLGDSGQTKEMLEVTRRMLELAPGNANAFFMQAVMAARAKRYDLSRSILYRVGDRMDDVPAMRLLRAGLSLQSGNAEQAITQLQELRKVQPSNLAIRRLLGAAMWRSGDTESTIAALEPIAARADADSYSLSVIGRAYERQGNRAMAGQYLDRASQPGRGQALPFSLSGDLLRLAKANAGPSDNADQAVPYINKLVLDGQNREAIQHATRLRNRNPGAPAAHLLLGDALMANDQPAEAAKSYRAAAGIRFTEPVAMRMIDALSQADQMGEALRTLDLFLGQNPRSVPGLLMAADHFMETGQWPEAITILEGLRFRLGNRDGVVLSYLGWARFNTGETDQGLSMLGAAYGMAPSNPAFADAYGWALFQSGRNREGGVSLLAKAVSIAPEHPGLRFHYGSALAGMKRKGEARTHLAYAAAAKDFPERKDAEKLLAGL
jgi:cellulose synthase operon protein C